jgi:hypothetical protein
VMSSLRAGLSDPDLTVRVVAIAGKCA